MPKPSTRRIYAQDQLFHTYGHKVFTYHVTNKVYLLHK
jgi:hypothetical protein